MPVTPAPVAASRLISLACCLLLAACGSPDTPLDAETRQTIDSIAVVRINLLRSEMDTLCNQRRVAELPHLIDSIKQHRMREIQDQLKTVPK